MRSDCLSHASEYDWNRLKEGGSHPESPMLQFDFVPVCRRVADAALGRIVAREGVPVATQGDAAETSGQGVGL